MSATNLRIGFGGTSITTLPTAKQAQNLLDSAFEFGIRHFDTAPLYGKGYSELLFGKFLKPYRKQITITTKFGLGDGFDTKIPAMLTLPLNFLLKKVKGIVKSNGSMIKNNNTEHIPIHYRKIDLELLEKSLVKSLERLQTDYIDYYMIHEALPHFLTEEAWSYLLASKQKGIIKYIGLGSNIQDIQGLTSADCKNIDVMQYEGTNLTDAKKMLEKFPDLLHFQHSCLRNMGNEEYSDIQKNEIAGVTLAKAALNNPQGKIIFSTKSTEKLHQNTKTFEKYFTEH